MKTHPHRGLSLVILRISSRSAGSSLGQPTFRRLPKASALPTHQLAMPSKDRFRLHQPAQGWSRHQASQGGHDRAVGRRQLGPIDLAAQDSKLVPQKQYPRLSVLEPKSNVNDVEHHAQPRMSNQ
jgi:hypothetical protein